MFKVIEGLAVFAIVFIIAFSSQTSQAADQAISVTIKPLSEESFKVSIDIGDTSTNFELPSDSLDLIDQELLGEEDLHSLTDGASEAAREDQRVVNVLDGNPKI